MSKTFSTIITVFDNKPNVNHIADIDVIALEYAVDQFSLMSETMDDLRSYYYVGRSVKLIECGTQSDNN